jgi:hypothetical protein
MEIIRTIKIRLTFDCYLNRMDRSYYYFFYDAQKYKQYESSQVYEMAGHADFNGQANQQQMDGKSNYIQRIYEFPNKFDSLLKLCSNYVS